LSFGLTELAEMIAQLEQDARKKLLEAEINVR
jgi:hypothetical protein